MQKTSLNEMHQKLKAKLIDFGGWQMPVSYESVLKEHKSVREGCGIFDVSHMGEIWVTGRQASDFLQFLTINNIEKIGVSKGQYTAILTEDGGMIDDLILYQLALDSFLLCVNASNTDKDYEWIKKQSEKFDCQVENRSHEFSQIAIQGPKSLEPVLSLAESEDKVADLKYMEIMPLTVFGQNAYLARTGYTGEQGFEIYLPNEIAPKVWSHLLEFSQVKPIGLGARDTLRLEACYLLYGNDMNDTVSPLEAGISWAVDLKKEFIGQKALLAQKESGVPRRIAAFTMEDQGIARHGMEIFAGDKKIGEVTSGSFLPTLGKAGGMALLDAGVVKVGDNVEIDVRGKRKLARIAKRPLYTARTK